MMYGLRFDPAFDDETRFGNIAHPAADVQEAAGVDDVGVVAVGVGALSEWVVLREEGIFSYLSLCLYRKELRIDRGC